MLADAARAERTVRLRDFNDDRHNLDRRILCGRNLVVREVRVQQLALLAVANVLVERGREALQEPARHLSAHEVRIDGLTHIHTQHGFEHAHLAGRFVHGQLHGRRAYGVVHVRVAALTRFRVAGGRCELGHEHARSKNRPAEEVAVRSLDSVNDEALEWQREVRLRPAFHHFVFEVEILLFETERAMHCFEHFFARLGRGRAHRVPAAPRHVRADGLPLIRVAVGVRQFDAYFRHGHREHLGRDLRHDRQEALSDFHAGDGEIHAPVFIEFQERGRGRIRRHRGRFPEAGEALADDLVRIFRFLLAAPLNFRRDAVNGLVQPARVHFRAIGQRVAFLDRVLAAERDGIHADLLRDPVHVRLEPEPELRIAESAIRSARRQVGVDAERINLHVRHAIGAGRGETDSIDDVRAVLDVRARIPMQRVVNRGDRTVPLRPELDVRDDALPLVRVVELLRARPAYLDGRPLHGERERDAENFHRDAGFAAEAAADVGRDHAHVLVRQAERRDRLREHVALRVGRL